MNLIIRREQPADFPGVFELNKLAFGQEGEARLVEALRKNKDVFIPELSLVATTDNILVGHILFTKIKIIGWHPSEFTSLALAPMAVSPKFQKSGIGRRLIKEGLLKAKELGYTSVIVLGHEQYYPKFGFVPTNTWGIKAPFDVPQEAFMGIELVTNSLKNVSGTVTYPKEFEMV